MFVDPTGDQEINVKPSSQWELQENGTLYCADYNAVAAIILMDSSVDRVLTSDEIYSSFAPEGAYNNVELSWTTSVKGSDGQEWVSKSYNVVTDNYHCNTFFATAKERTVAFIECTFSDEADRYMVELLLMDLCENAVIQKYIPLNAKKTEEVTTEEGTSEDVSTEETPTEEVPTEETTTEQPTTTEAPTTEAPTTETPTTEAPTTETPTTEQATTQQPSTREPAKPKKPTNSLDVEW